MILPSCELPEMCEIVWGLGPIVPSSSTPVCVSLKNYQGCSILIHGRGTNTVTSGAITLVQATSIAGTTNKTAAIATAWRNTDCTNTTTILQLEKFTVSNNTFASPTTTGLGWQFVIQVDPSKLDVAGGYDCVRAGIGDMGGQTVSVQYLLWPARYSGTTKPSARVD